MLRASGLQDDDFTRPLIGVANTWIEIGPCNYHLRDLAVHVKAGIRAAGGTPMEFNTVSISDGITMGTEGMRASLVSREVIADSIELVTRGNGFDSLVVLGACGGQFTANTMAIASEFLGIAALGSGSVPANDPNKAEVARLAGTRVMDLVRSGLKPRDVMTRASLENAIASVATTGGSTNAV